MRISDWSSDVCSSDLEVVPEAGSSDQWCSLQNAFVWDEKGYRLLRMRRLVKAGVNNLADPELGTRRLERICATLAQLSLREIPNEKDVACWPASVAV